MSKKRAIQIFSHLHTDMGERVNTQKFAAHLPGSTLHDIESLIGIDYPSIASLNLELAAGGHAPISSPLYDRKIVGPTAILSWSSGVAAMLATGITPSIVKIYVHQPQERVLTPLYQSASLRITESLLASEKARGLGRTLYIPHHYTAAPPPSRDYIIGLAERLGKPLRSDAIVVGTFSRLEYWKNPEFAIEAVRQLQGSYPVVLLLKGNFPKQRVYPDYDANLRDMLTAYQDEPWFYWDPHPTPYPDVLSEYAACDFALQPSGAEGGSNLVVELMAMGKPVIVLNATTNPYLFKGGALFAEAEPGLQAAQLAYARPKLEALKEAIIRLCDPTERRLWGELARRIAEQRFHPSIAQQRIELMAELIENEEPIDHLEEEDRRRYEICF